jgi:hypothetical protein
MGSVGNDVLDQSVGLTAARQIGHDDQSTRSDDRVLSNPDEDRASSILTQAIDMTFGHVSPVARAPDPT